MGILGDGCSEERKNRVNCQIQKESSFPFTPGFILEAPNSLNGFQEVCYRSLHVMFSMETPVTYGYNEIVSVWRA